MPGMKMGGGAGRGGATDPNWMAEQPSDILKLYQQLQGMAPQAPTLQAPQLTPPSVVDPDVAVSAQRNSALVGGLQNVAESFVNAKASPNWYMMQHGIPQYKSDMSGAFGGLRQMAKSPLERATLQAANQNTMAGYQNQQAVLNTSVGNQNAQAQYGQKKGAFDLASQQAQAGAAGNLQLKLADKNIEAMRQMRLWGMQKIDPATTNKAAILDSADRAADGIDALMQKYGGSLGPLIRHVSFMGAVDRLNPFADHGKDNELATDANMLGGYKHALDTYEQLGIEPRKLAEARMQNMSTLGLQDTDTNQSWSQKRDFIKTTNANWRSMQNRAHYGGMERLYNGEMPNQDLANPHAVDGNSVQPDYANPQPGGGSKPASTSGPRTGRNSRIDALLKKRKQQAMPGAQ